MSFRNTVQSNIVVATTVVLSLMLLTGSVFAADMANQDATAKNLAPASGKSLVYFFYGRACGWGDLELSLDGASTSLNKDMFVLWEVPAGDHELSIAIPPRGLSSKPAPVTASLTIETKAGSVSYYRLISDVDDDYRLTPIRTSTGRKYVADKTLVSWFQDGALVYQNEQLLASAE